jgi:hypothetical protein
MGQGSCACGGPGGVASNINHFLRQVLKLQPDWKSLLQESVCIIRETFEINERGETGHQVDAIVTVPVHVGHEKVAVALLHARVKTPDPGAVSLKYGVSGTP